MTATFQLDDLYNVLLDINNDHEVIYFFNIEEHYIEFDYFWAKFHLWTRVYDRNQEPNTLVLKNTHQYLKANFLGVSDFRNLINTIFDAINYDDELDMMQPCSFF